MAKHTLIKGGTIISVDKAVGDLPNGDVLIEDNRIVSIAPNIEGPPDAEIIDATDRLVMPGMVDTHRHTWQALFRNLASDWTLSPLPDGPARNRQRALSSRGHLRRQPPRRLEALDSGITTLLDWCHNFNTPEHTDAAVQAHVDSGGRVVFGHGGGHRHWSRPSALDHPQDDVAACARAGLQRRPAGHAMPRPRGNQFATMDVTERDWALAAELGSGSAAISATASGARTGRSPRLRRRGLLGPTMTFVHCNSLADDELKMMADAGVQRVGLARHRAADGARLAGDRASAGGRHPAEPLDRRVQLQRRPYVRHDARDHRHAARLRQRVGARAGKASVDEMELTCREVLEFATIEGARACGMDRKIGSLAPGKRADIILVRTDTLSMTPLNNPDRPVRL